jgi:hypothetical protein
VHIIQVRPGVKETRGANLGAYSIVQCEAGEKEMAAGKRGL